MLKYVPMNANTDTMLEIMGTENGNVRRFMLEVLELSANKGLNGVANFVVAFANGDLEDEFPVDQYGTIFTMFCAVGLKDSVVEFAEFMMRKDLENLRVDTTVQ